MNKKLRQQVYEKFNGLCAYTGKPLGDDWQVDHVTPIYLWKYFLLDGDPNNIDNLMPAIKIINHYKRAKDIKLFREYLISMHTRIAKLPKNPYTDKAIKRKDYMMNITSLFDISPDKPFSGVFYFESIVNEVKEEVW